MVYFPGNAGPPSTYVNSSPTDATIYCTDFYDPYSITVSSLVTLGGASSNKYAAIAVLDSSGNVLVYANLSEPSGSNANKFTGGNLPVTLSPGLHSWCHAFETGASGSHWKGSASYANWLNIAVTGASKHNYSCSVAPTGSGATFAIPANGNCATSGTRTAISVLNPGWVTVLVNP